MKKIISILLGIFMISAFLTQAFGQKELEVMKRYDYSSPKASFESLKKAINEKDIEGILIHQWQMSKLAKGAPVYGMSFEDFLAYNTKIWSEQWPKEKALEIYNEIQKSANPLKITELDFVEEWPRELVLMFCNRLEQNPLGNLRVTELDFVKEDKREHEDKDPELGVGITTCWIILERKSDGKQFRDLAFAENYDGTSEWWITLWPRGE